MTIEPRALAQRLEGKARTVKRPEQNDVDDALETVGRQLLRRTNEVTRGIVDQHVDPPGARRDFPHGALDARRIADVAFDGEGDPSSRTDRFDRFVELLRRRPITQTDAPSRAKESAMARPKPVPPPVTTAVLPS